MAVNWGKLFDIALTTGAKIANTEVWINEKIDELSYEKSSASALIEIAYEIGKMDNDNWNYFITHLKIKASKNNMANYMYAYCNRVVGIENSSIKDMLSYSLDDAWDSLRFDLKNSMNGIEDVAAYYGLLKAHSEKNGKARSLTMAFEKLLNSGT